MPTNQSTSIGAARATICLSALFVSTLGSLAMPAHANDPIPAGRRIDWTYAGVPGGIPNRTTACATLSPGASAAAINGALSSCNEGVVKLNPGTYSVTGISISRSNVTLRGSGADQTILKGCNIVRLGSGGNLTSGIAITGGAAKDSRSFTVASATGLAAGTMIEIDRADDASFVVSTVGSSRNIRQVNVVTGIAGNTVSVRNPLIWDFNAGSPRIKYTFNSIRRSGVEDLRLDHSGTSGCTNFALEYCESCWLKGIQSFNASSYHFTILGTTNGEIRNSYVHESQTFGSNNAGLAFYGSDRYGSNSSWKIENNIFNKLFPAIELQNGSSGFYIGYNFVYGSAATASNAPVSWTFADNHGPHDMMNLWEGNVGEMFGSDGYFGGSSHATAFRNHFTGYNRNSGRTDEPVRLNRFSYYYNIVGNVLGSSAWSPAKYNQTSDNCAGGPGMYRLGYPNIGNCSLTDVTGNAAPGGMSYPDTRVASTLLRWGNFDYSTRTTRWLASELPAGTSTPSDQSLPASYLYTSRPAWFPSGAPWPAIGPDVTTGGGFGDNSGHVGRIPAQQCWDSRNLVADGTFNAAACYAVASGPVPNPPTDVTVDF